MNRFIVKSSAAKMPASLKFGRYKRVAVIEVGEGVEDVAMISERARGVVRVVRTWERLSVGQMVRSAYAVALREAWELAARLNEEALSGASVVVAWTPSLYEVA